MSRNENQTASERDHKESTDVKIRIVLWDNGNSTPRCNALRIAHHPHSCSYKEMAPVTINRVEIADVQFEKSSKLSRLLCYNVYGQS